ncbi:MAG TPA: Mov34/MPN/PAD-1 family protein [Ktedonobacteraceae bacterium]|nr:Mov34/MPN/PAD-1 family protein [Ktedonobacteraceae bacterium]
MEESGRAQLILSARAQDQLLQDVYNRSDIEACGLLTGAVDAQGNWQVDEAHPLRNIHQSPVYFEFAAEELLMFELEHPGEVIGVYHSHPTGFPTASATDRQNMQRVNVEQQIPWAWLIICGPFSASHFPYAEQLAHHSLIAYHHYASGGLQHLRVLLRESTGTTKKTPDSYRDIQAKGWSSVAE